MQELSLNRRHRSLVWHCNYHSTPGCRSRQNFQGVAPAVATEEGLKNTNGAGEKTGARGKGGVCNAWTEQVREPHLNNTHTHFKNLNTLSPTIRARCFEFGVLKVSKKYPNVLFSRINFIDLFTNFCV